MLRILCALFLLGFASAAAAAKPVPPTIEQLAAFPKISGFALSPDGQHLAALEARGEDRVILVWRTDALNAAPTVIGSTQMKIQGVQFVKNDLLAVTMWQRFDLRTDILTKAFISKLFITDLQGKTWREPLPLPNPKSEDEKLAQSLLNPTVLDGLVNDPDNILVVNNIGATSGDVYKVNIRTNRAERIQRREEHIGDYFTNLAGVVAGRSRADSDAGGSFISTEFRNPATGAWDEHFRSYVKTRDQTQVIGFTNDPNIALIRSNVGRDKAAIYEYDVAKRARVDTLFEHRFFEASGVRAFRYAGPQLGEIIGLIYDGPRQNDVQWVSPQFKAIDTALRQALNIRQGPVTFVDPGTGQSTAAQYDTGLAYDLLGYSADLKTILVSVQSPSQPPIYYLLKDGKLALLAKTYPDLDPAAFGETKLVYYKARDGLDIPAFLTTPNTELCGPGPWKAVVHPHGGPWARDAMRFDGSMWIPLMASRCMAVLRPQYRGTDGWSRKLWLAGDKEWGGKMQDDKDDGAKWLIDQKIAKPDHIAMFGFSYGGYAAFAASVRPNGLYKCAIAGAGVSDLGRIGRKFYSSSFYLEGQGPTISGLSPLDKADAIQIPILVYAGDRDQTVPMEQSQLFVAKAKRAGKDVVYKEFVDYAHGPAWTRKIEADQLQLLDDYFAKGCGGGGL
ncbi:hypothetical protein BH11PSE2_BH11PSE2_00090 [soil metagenome]